MGYVTAFLWGVAVGIWLVRWATRNGYTIYSIDAEQACKPVNDSIDKYRK